MAGGCSRAIGEPPDRPWWSTVALSAGVVTCWLEALRFPSEGDTADDDLSRESIGGDFNKLLDACRSGGGGRNSFF